MRKEVKTTMSNDIMNKIAKIIEVELKSKKIFYLRDGTKFNVKESDINKLLDIQMGATMKLVKEGTITLDMMLDDVKANF